jgi:signal transduction histidine kinase
LELREARKGKTVNPAEIKKSDSAFAEHAAAVAVDLVERAGTGFSRCILLGISEAALAKRLASEIKTFAPESHVITVSKLEQVRELAASHDPKIIFLDSNLLGDKALAEVVQELVAVAPVLVLASINSQTEMSRLVAVANVEFIGRVGDYVPLAAALIERRLNAVGSPDARGHITEPRSRPRIAELFRHEINNPLTGILGNAELVLAHREHLSPVEVQRLQTVVDLAVRLRESIRRMSDACEENFTREPGVKTALS